ncbi:nuclear transport factor 2 family protein [Undibacterium sp. Ji49W]|uniref:nuclear transport factor 2 family protein n=1 Tax=Undibacterium sp. Ji49W TaxID=3413040 RepID=UPI003BF25A62
MDATEIRALTDRYIDAYNRKDIATMLLTIHAGVEFSNISMGVVNAHTVGAAEFKALAEQSVALFSERHQDIIFFENGENTAVAGIKFRAVVAIDLPNGLKKGQVLEMDGRSEFEFRDGLISKIKDIS